MIFYDLLCFCIATEQRFEAPQLGCVLFTVHHTVSHVSDASSPFLLSPACVLLDYSVPVKILESGEDINLFLQLKLLSSSKYSNKINFQLVFKTSIDFISLIEFFFVSCCKKLFSFGNPNINSEAIRIN
jgi:hypothetical protein